MTDTTLVWFRRDLRSYDHAALYEALTRARRVHCAFIFDREILDPLQERGLVADRRVHFIHRSLVELDAELRRRGGGLIVRYGYARTEIPALAAELGADTVFVNHDYEPAATSRDADVAAALAADGRQLLSFKDGVIFEKSELLTGAGKPYSVFTPYKNAWMRAILAVADPVNAHPSLQAYLSPVDDARLAPAPQGMPSLEDMGFVPAPLTELGIEPGMSGAQALLEGFLDRIADYDVARNFPSRPGTSHMSVHLRFGTVSVRALVRRALEAMHNGTGGSGAAVWLSELIWRDFYFMILHHHPHVAERAFKPEYDRIAWESGQQAEDRFDAWCRGATGYPLVDAAMRQLNETGFMHNRLRMVTASFLIKDLGIDYRWGERYFAERLNDFDLAANNGGWQWAASSGCDAQPYFRIFNPVTQSERFDPDGSFIRRWLPQLSRLSARDIHAPWLAPQTRLREAGIVLGANYPEPVVMHDEARERTQQRYLVIRKTA
ncbi:cryptochrome/photolyase family protein [Noviherbaspirillum pedocola]|uniref:Deoxyribodipyrimidine photo-lyase n=1 Tax=Noviherbaspirillum pedocola TaxID=2801341 RepID=A0A934SQS0_9BURK|nr:deoxyribodipyrimidine photo-lyase [Noviherbaspirillum pedocola]MBK4733401.1 deoxyribodipyrimidine photo-lyase [Noviherbaspirillum pedocola]